MLKQQAKLFNWISVLTDAALIFVAYLSAFYTRALLVNMDRNSHSPALQNLFSERWQEHPWFLIIIFPCWYILLRHFGFYSSLRTRPVKELFSNLFKITIIGCIITTSTIYFFHPEGHHRRLIILFAFYSFIFLVAEKSLLRMTLGMLRCKGFNYRNLLIVGIPANTGKFISLVEQHRDWGLRIVGLLAISNEEVDFRENYPVLGTLDDMVRLCKQHTIDEVIFCVSRELHGHIRCYLKDIQEMGITIRLALDFYETPRSKMDLYLFLGEIPMITFYAKPFDVGQLVMKRLLDIVGALAGLLITAFLFPFIALAIKIDSPGPVIFGQKRVGEGGRVFNLWKFRSMYTDAEIKKLELNHLNEMNGAIFKIRNDPRITRVGRFLRRTSLDEFPQFWNVLHGEMSLVGTRPPTPDEVDNYENWHRKRISIKPGITGLWQVSGRNQITNFDEVAKLDIKYIEKWSLWLDIKLIIRTLWVVFNHSGAC